MAHYRRHVVPACFCVGAALTPTDVVSQVLLAVPLYLIYEIGLWLEIALSYLKRRASAKTECLN